MSSRLIIKDANRKIRQDANSTLNRSIWYLTSSLLTHPLLGTGSTGGVLHGKVGLQEMAWCAYLRPPKLIVTAMLHQPSPTLPRSVDITHSATTGLNCDRAKTTCMLIRYLLLMQATSLPDGTRSRWTPTCMIRQCQEATRKLIKVTIDLDLCPADTWRLIKATIELDFVRRPRGGCDQGEDRTRPCPTAAWTERSYDYIVLFFRKEMFRCEVTW
jgi:hypothetical protein